MNVAYENGNRCATPQSELPRVESHDDLEIAKSLEKLAEELERAKLDPYAWKWVIITLHNAIQATIVRAISGGDQTGALRAGVQEATRKWLRAHLVEGKEAGEMPKPLLADFRELYKRAKKRPGVVVSPKLDEDMRRLNEYRRQLVHYAPLIWVILVKGMPELVLRCLDFVESLMPGRPTGGAQWLYEAEGGLAERSLGLARERAEELRERYCGKLGRGGKVRMEPEKVFLDSLDWLKQHYGDHSFFVERDLVWTLQQHLRVALAETGLTHLVFNDFPMLKGNRRSLCADLAIVDQQGGVSVAAEFKYEPDHARAGRNLEIWPTKVDPSVVFWGKEGVLKDVMRIREFVDQGKTPVAYSIFIDEGGSFRHLKEHPGAEWRDWSCGGAKPRRVSVLQGVYRRK